MANTRKTKSKLRPLAERPQVGRRADIWAAFPFMIYECEGIQAAICKTTKAESLTPSINSSLDS